MKRADTGPQRAVGYARVSTRTQDKEGTSLITQEARIREYAESQGWQVASVLSDAHTGTELWERPKMSELREMAKRGEIDVVICYAFDRLSREPAHQQFLMVEFARLGVRIESVTEPNDGTMQSEIMQTIGGVLAKWENVKRRERSMRGMRARVDGAKDGTPRLLVGRNALLGYRWRDARKSAYDVDETTAPLVRRIFREFAAGKPLLAIAADLTAEGIYPPRARHTGNTVWAARTLHGMLTHPAYKGEAWAYASTIDPETKAQVKRDKAERVLLPEGTIPPIVSPELWQAAQDRLQRHKIESTRNGRIANATALLRAGFIVCGVCGWRMYVSKTTRGVTRYQCQSKSKTSGFDCRYHSIDADTIDDIVWTRVTTALADRDRMRGELERLRANDPTADDLLIIDQTLSDLRGQATNVELGIRTAKSAAVVATLTATLDEIATKVELLERDRAALATRRGEWEAGIRVLSDDAAAHAAYVELSRGCDGDMNAMRDRLAALGVKVSVFPSHWDGPRWKIEARVDLANGPLVPWWNVPDETAADWLGTGNAFMRQGDAELRRSACRRAEHCIVSLVWTADDADEFAATWKAAA